MTNRHCLSALTLLMIASLACAQERKLDKANLPQPVAAAVARETQGATVKGYATEIEGGKKVYEAETIVDGHTRDLQFAADGTLNEVEEEVALTSLPAPVQSGLKTKAGKATIIKVEALTKRGKLMAYEAATRLGAKKGEVQVGPAGETLKHNQ